MSRSGYNEYSDNNWDLICWRGAVARAIKGKRGQAFLREMLAALDRMEQRRLIADELVQEGEVCALGAVGVARGIDMSQLDPNDSATVAAAFGIANALAREIVYENDEGVGYWVENETPEARYERMRRWIAARIKARHDPEKDKADD